MTSSWVGSPIMAPGISPFFIFKNSQMSFSCKLLSALPKSSDDTREDNNNNKNQCYYSNVTENSRQNVIGRNKVGESFKEVTGSSSGSKIQSGMLDCSNLSMQSV